MVKKLTKKQLLITLGGLILIAAAAFYLKYGYHKTVKSEAVQSKQELDPGTPTNKTPAGQSSIPTPNPSREPNSNTANASSSLPNPTGQVINIHNISLSSTSGQTNSNVESTCQTILKASCYVRVTGAKTVTIQPTSSDSNGQFIFDWNVGQVGLTVGDWNVELIAQLNGQTASSGAEVIHVTN